MNLNHYVTIERQQPGQSDTGQPNGPWEEIGEEWAAISPISGREYFNASGERAEVTHQIDLRAGGSYVPRDRVVYGDRIFNIKSVLNLEERGRWLKLMVSEYVPG